MKNNPDNRRDNVERIQENINHIIQNIDESEEMLNIIDNEKSKNDIKEKNQRRMEALSGLRKEIKDEADFQKNSQ